MSPWPSGLPLLLCTHPHSDAPLLTRPPTHPPSHPLPTLGADIVVVCDLHFLFQTLVTPAQRAAYPSVTRWFLTCANLPAFAGCLGGAPALADKAATVRGRTDGRTDGWGEWGEGGDLFLRFCALRARGVLPPVQLKCVFFLISRPRVSSPLLSSFRLVFSRRVPSPSPRQAAPPPPQAAPERQSPRPTSLRSPPTRPRPPLRKPLRRPPRRRSSPGAAPRRRKTAAPAPERR